MLAAFITPNHSVIAPVIKRASEILGNWTGSPALDEYQTRDQNRIKKQMAAVYETIGIHPLVVIVKGHEFAGGWLIPDSFQDSVNDDVSLLTKRAA